MEVDISKKVNYFIKYGLIGAVIVAFLCATGVWYYHQHHQYFTVYDAQVASTLVGTKAQTAGTIEKLVVADGDHVEAGDVIAQIKVNITEEQIQQLQQTVDLSKKNLQEVKAGVTVPGPAVNSGGGRSGGGDTVAAQAELDRAATALERMNQLYAIGAISAVRRNQAAADYSAAQSALAAAQNTVVSVPSTTYQSSIQEASSPEVIKNAELQVKQAQMALDTAKKNVSATEILAPVAGTVYYTDVAEGSEVKPGQIIVNIGDADKMWLEIHLTADQHSKIRLGEFVSYTIENHKLQGTIFDLGTAADASDDSDAATEGTSNTEASTTSTNDDGRFISKISLPTDIDFNLKPGMKGIVKLLIQ
ncbi:MAG: efflux RND transporter periplasmic adaptor subunit [Selenomonadaceae bacterium]